MRRQVITLDGPLDVPVSAPLRAKARALGDADGINLRAGQAYRLAVEAPLGEIVERWRTDLARLGAPVNQRKR